MVDKFGMGAFSMIVVEDMPAKDTQKLKETIKSIDHVEKVLWYDDLADITVPHGNASPENTGCVHQGRRNHDDCLI